MNLSSNFTTDEMLRSDAATRLGFGEQFMPSDEIIANLTALCENVLEPLRTKLGLPILITSGYRCQRLNVAIGGAASSQHTLGQAADIHVEDMLVHELYEWIKKSNLPFDQLISEFDRWVHISYKVPQRHSCLIASKVNGQTVYSPDNIET